MLAHVINTHNSSDNLWWDKKLKKKKEIYDENTNMFKFRR